MTSSDGDRENVLTELNDLSLKRQQLIERRKIQCIFQEMRNRAEFGQTAEAASNLREIDNIDDKLKQLTKRKAELQINHENFPNAEDMKHGKNAESKDAEDMKHGKNVKFKDAEDMKHGKNVKFKDAEDMKHGKNVKFKDAEDMKHGKNAESKDAEDMKHGKNAESKDAEDMKHGKNVKFKDDEDMKHEASISSRQIVPDVPVPCSDSFYVESPPNIPAPTVILDVNKLPPRPCRTQCPECKQFIMTETFTSASSVTWMVCFMVASIGCVVGCCLIPFCMDQFKSVTHRCPRCRTSIMTIKKL